MTIPTLMVDIQFQTGIWTDVTDWLVRSAEITRGSSRVESPVIRYEPGHITIRLRNEDRRFDSTNLQGPYVVGGVSNVTAMRPIRLQAKWKGVVYPLFQGFVDQFDVNWISNVYSEVVVTATDGFKVLRNKRRAATVVFLNGEFFTQTYGEGEDSGARINRILTSADWDLAQSVIATGDSLLQATPLSGDALQELQDVAETEIGELYIDAQGRVVFRNRHAILTDTRSTVVQAEFGLHFNLPMSVDMKLNSDDATMWNESVVTRIGGSARVNEDTASVARNQYKTFEKSGLWLIDDTTVDNYGEWIVYISKDPEVRFDTLVLKPNSNPDFLFLQIHIREFGDRIRITRYPPGGGLPINREVFIRGINHNVGQEDWTTQWVLQSATRYVPNFFILGSSTNGVLGQNILSY
jgi:hypothetical protein